MWWPGPVIRELDVVPSGFCKKIRKKYSSYIFSLVGKAERRAEEDFYRLCWPNEEPKRIFFMIRKFKNKFPSFFFFVRWFGIEIDTDMRKIRRLPRKVKPYEGTYCNEYLEDAFNMTAKDLH